MLRQIAFKIQEMGGRAFLVGGSVRDAAMGLDPKDADVEVFGVHRDALVEMLSQFGKPDMCGASFGVIKLWAGGEDFDFSLPRRDSKVGKGHKGFVPEFSDLTPEEAAERRDFTWDAMMQDIITGEVFDFFGGMEDIESRTIRATSEAFREDPLRVLRGMQFAGRFEMSVERHTAQVCSEMFADFHDLSIERVWTEFEKWAVKSSRPSFGLRFLEDTLWAEHFPEVARLMGLHQDPQWHPEGDTFEHTCQAVDAAADIAVREGLSKEDRMVLVFSALCHDFGKVETTEFVDGHIRSRGHADASEAPTRAFMARIGAPAWLVERVVPLAREHMVFCHPHRPTARAVRRLSVRLGDASVQMLAWVMEADQRARGPAGHVHGIVQEMVALAEREQCHESQVQPILMGRHLIQMGMRPSREFGRILAAAFERQLEGDISSLEEAMEWAREQQTP